MNNNDDSEFTAQNAIRELSRRDLLGTAAVGGAALVFGGCAAADEDDAQEGDPIDPGLLDDIAEHDGVASNTYALASTTPMCGETPDNPLGPFYKANAPLRNNISQTIQVGVSGTLSLMQGGTCRRLANTIIDVWHAVPGLAQYYDMSGWRGRALVRTNARGEYWFRTVLPPKYPDPNLGLRPRHIHLRVRSGGRELVTQLYFAGDSRLGPDPFDLPELIVPFSSQTRVINGVSTKVLIGAFHIVM
jgi:protocatechuate 3,4-dioxygenase beta subunit